MSANRVCIGISTSGCWGVCMGNSISGHLCAVLYFTDHTFMANPSCAFLKFTHYLELTNV